MIKEFSKLTGKFDIQINLTNSESFKNIIEANIVFIPKEKDHAKLPINVYGDVNDVENSIRHQLMLAGEKDNIEEKIKDQTKFGNEGNVEVLKEMKKEIVEKSGVPENNVIIAKVKTIPDSGSAAIKAMQAIPKDKIIESLNDPKVVEAMDKAVDEITEVVKEVEEEKEKPKLNLKFKSGKTKEITKEEKPKKQTNICEKCQLPDSVVEAGTCIYADCPNGKQKDCNEDGMGCDTAMDGSKPPKNHLLKDELDDCTAEMLEEAKPKFTKEQHTKANYLGIEGEFGISQEEKEFLNQPDPEPLPDGSQSSKVAEGECDNPWADEDAQIKADQEAWPKLTPAGHCNISREEFDKEKKYEDKATLAVMQAQEEEEISEQEQMIIDEQNRALSEAENKKREEKEASDTASYMDAQAEAENNGSWNAPTFDF